jgi:hypothetical protein
MARQGLLGTAASKVSSVEKNRTSFWHIPALNHHDPTSPIFLSLSTCSHGLQGFLLIVNVADATKKVRWLFTYVLHPVWFHAGNENRGSGGADFFLNEFVGFGIECPALEGTIEYIHSLVVKVVVNRDLSSRLNGEQSQAVVRVTMSVISVLGKPPDAGSGYIMHFALVRKLFDFFLFATFTVYNVHMPLLFPV